MNQPSAPHVFQVTPSRALSPAGGFLEHFTHTLNPYSGCAFGRLGCPFCYVRQHLPQRFGPRDQDGQSIPWGSWVKVRTGIGAVLRRQLGKPEARDYRVYMGSVTDPYQPAEVEHRLSRACLEAFGDNPVAHLTLQTRSVLWGEDLELISSLDFVVVNITVETDNLRIHRLFTRSSAAPSRRLALAAQARRLGIPVAVTVSPLLPLKSPDDFARRIADAADFAVVDTLALGDGAGGRRSRKNGMPERLAAAGFDSFMEETETFDALVSALRESLGEDKVGISQSGFAAAASTSIAG